MTTVTEVIQTDSI